MDTAGKAVLFSGAHGPDLAVGRDARAEPGVPVDGLGIMLSVVFILAATLTLLPAVLAKLGPRVDKLSLPWVHSGEHRSPRFAAWGERLWRRRSPTAPSRLSRSSRWRSRCSASTPACRRSRSCPRATRSRQGYEQVQPAFGARRAGSAADRRARRPTRQQVARDREGRPGHRASHAGAPAPAPATR